MNEKKLVAVVAISLLGILLMVGAVPGEEYPVKDIRHIIPWSAGGGTDTAMRGFVHYAEKYLPVVKKPVAIYSENLTGAQSGIGVLELMKSKPDGYTVGTLTWDSVITVPYYDLVPGYDLEKLEFICTVTVHATSLVVGQDAPWQTLDEFIADAKKRPGEIKAAVDGIGGGSHLGYLKWEEAAGIELKYIPYPGGAGGQIEALLSGEVDVVGSTGFGDYFPILDSGDARGLAIFAPARLPKNPDVPTMTELGYDVVHGSFVIVAAPAGTPEEVVKILERAFYKAHHSAEFRDWLAKVGVEASWLDSEATTKWALEFQQGEFALIKMLEEQGLL